MVDASCLAPQYCRLTADCFFASIMRKQAASKQNYSLKKMQHGYSCNFSYAVADANGGFGAVRQPLDCFEF